MSALLPYPAQANLVNRRLLAREISVYASQSVVVSGAETWAKSYTETSRTDGYCRLAFDENLIRIKYLGVLGGLL